MQISMRAGYARITIVINPLTITIIMKDYTRKDWLNAIISALVAFLTALGASSCAQAIL